LRTVSRDWQVTQVILNGSTAAIARDGYDFVTSRSAETSGQRTCGRTPLQTSRVTELTLCSPKYNQITPRQRQKPPAAAARGPPPRRAW
jgi:hypothetical protein